MHILCKIALFSLAIVIPLTGILLFLYSDSFKKTLLEIFGTLNELPIVINFPILLTFGVLIIVCCLPISYYEFLLGFSLRSLILALSVEFFLKIFATLITYLLSKKWLKNLILSKYRKKSFFKGMKLFLENRKCLHLLYLRLLFIPLFLKNYLLPIFDVPTNLYFSITIIVDVLAGFWMVLLGYGMRNFSDFEGRNIENVRFFVFLILSVLIIAYIMIFTRRKMKEFETLENKEEVVMV